jgi:hypothetical protein
MAGRYRVSGHGSAVTASWCFRPSINAPAYSQGTQSSRSDIPTTAEIRGHCLAIRLNRRKTELKAWLFEPHNRGCNES